MESNSHSMFQDQEQERVGITVLGSGSNGNAIVLHRQGEAILVDAGFSARELRRRLREAGIDETALRAVIVSHEHIDHIKGLRVCARQLGLPIYSNRGTAAAVRDREKDIGRLNIFTAGTPFDIGGFSVEPFSIPHDASDPMGFVIRVDGAKVGLATDLGHVSHLVSYQLRECDALIVESNHDMGMLQHSRRPWSLKQRIMGRHGHLSNRKSMELVRDVLHERTRHLILAHASRECNRYELVEQSARQCLMDLGRPDIVPLVARQDQSLPTVWL